MRVQGFKISLLPKLENIKAVDRSTSLLQFCIQQAADKSETLVNMANHLSHVKPAARLQVTAVDTLLGELGTGIKRAQEQVIEACAGRAGAEKARGEEEQKVRLWTVLRASLLRAGELHVYSAADVREFLVLAIVVSRSMRVRQELSRSATQRESVDEAEFCSIAGLFPHFVVNAIDSF
jgi:hypothetical protein